MARAGDETTADDVLELVALLEDHGVRVRLDGGWGVDALLGRQTRRHSDLDVAVLQDDVPRLRALLEARGFRDVPTPDAGDGSFVLGDGRGREVDVHSYALDERGRPRPGTAYSAEALTGEGLVLDRVVRCVSAAHLVRFHAGYELRQSDVADVLALHRKFGIPLPKEFEGRLPAGRRRGRVVGAIETLRPAARGTRVVAIDGHGGSGKSTAADALAATLPAVTIVRTDDFSRADAPGWDWRSLKDDVLAPIDRDEPGRYRRYDWPTGRLAEWRDVPAGGILVVEGVSSMRRELGPYWDLSIWVACAYEERLGRGVRRDGEGMRRQWVEVWMPEEERYVRAERPDLRADIVIDGAKRMEL